MMSQILTPNSPAAISKQTATCKVALLIPAYNEEESISDTIHAALLASPDVQFEFDIIVIADNCTDRTEEIVLGIIQELRTQEEQTRVFLMKTQGNKKRKAGALNQAFALIRELGYSFIATADADTIWDPNFLKNGLAAMEKKGEMLGGICGRVGLLPFKKEPFTSVQFTGKPISLAAIAWLMLVFFRKAGWCVRQAWIYLWWGFQNVEYCIGQAETIERMGKAHCLCGPGTIFRANVLEELYQKFGVVWPETMVEDFDLTIKMQMLGYETRVGHDMFVYTDCPKGFHTHGIQRERWNGGNLSTYINVSINRHTFFGGIEMGLQLVWFACRINLIVTAIQIWMTGFVYIDRLGFVLLTVPLLLVVGLNMFRFKYVAYKSLFQFLLLVCFGYELYALRYGIVLTKSYLKAFTNSITRWR